MIRNISILSKDSVVKTTVLDKVPKVKTILGTDYYWYYNNQICHNEGGFSGKLLNGKYQVFTSQNKLITEGEFLNGVMTGTWKYWYINGKMKCMAIYHKGKLDGTIDFFDIYGIKTRQVDYKAGLKHGKEYIFFTDTTLINKFDMGKLVVKKNRSSKTNHDSSISLSEKTPNDLKKISISKKEKLFPEDNTKSTVTKPKESWLKRVFKKTKKETSTAETTEGAEK